MSSILGLLLFLLLLALVLNVVSHILRVGVVDESCQRRPRLPTHWREPIEDGQEVRFQAEGGTVLSGTFFRRSAEPGRGIVVYSHELHADRWSALAYVGHLRAEGFDVFSFDYRLPGRSGSWCRWDDPSQVTETDIADLQAAIGAAVARCSVAEPCVSIVGVGKGAAVALAVAAREPMIRGLMLDSIGPLRGSPPPGRATSGAGWWNRLCRRLFCRPSANTFDLEQIAPDVHVPVLLIQGRNDAQVRLDAVRDLAARIAGQCQLWIVPRTGHAEAAHVDQDAYRRRTLKFLRRFPQIKPAATQKATREPATPVGDRGRVSSAPAR